jgi:hypothetical protein
MTETRTERLPNAVQIVVSTATFACRRRQSISGLTKQLLASQAQLCSLELGIVCALPPSRSVSKQLASSELAQRMVLPRHWYSCTRLYGVITKEATF